MLRVSLCLKANLLFAEDRKLSMKRKNFFQSLGLSCLLAFENTTGTTFVKFTMTYIFFLLYSGGFRTQVFRIHDGVEAFSPGRQKTAVGYYFAYNLAIFHFLQYYGHRSLEVFLDADGLPGPFMDYTPSVGNGRVSFEKTRLLVFRCETRMSLLPLKVIVMIAPSDKCLRESTALTRSENIQSDFMYLTSFQQVCIDNLDFVDVCVFSGCDCVLVETKVWSGKARDNIWQFAAERILLISSSPARKNWKTSILCHWKRSRWLHRARYFE